MNDQGMKTVNLVREARKINGRTLVYVETIIRPEPESWQVVAIDLESSSGKYIFKIKDWEGFTRA